MAPPRAVAGEGDLEAGGVVVDMGVVVVMAVVWSVIIVEGWGI